MKVKTMVIDENDVTHHDKNSQSKRELLFPFSRQNGQCQYKNEVNFENILIDNQESSKIKIINKLCNEKGNMLEKITTIKFGDHIITIKDEYCFETLGSRKPEQNKKKRIHIFKKPLNLKEQQGESHSKLTKNLPKNFIKAFINYLQDKKQDSNRDLLECKINLMMSRQKFNNNFIQQIVDDEQLQHYFKDFLNNYAQDWIQNSKIRNKTAHLEAINVFLKLRSSGSNGSGSSGNNSKENQGKIESTNSYSNSNNSGGNSNSSGGQYGKEESRGEEENLLSHGLNFGNSSVGDKDSIMANQSQNYCIHEK